MGSSVLLDALSLLSGPRMYLYPCSILTGASTISNCGFLLVDTAEELLASAVLGVAFAPRVLPLWVIDFPLHVKHNSQVVLLLWLCKQLMCELCPS
jgi:hypothetical protein